MPYSRIVGVGSALPKKVLTNSDLEKMMDTSDEWIRTRTGMVERRMTEPSEATSDLAVQAAFKALEYASMEPEELDCIIVTTVTPDMFFPATANFVQDRLGAKVGTPSFDLAAACTGFIYGMAVADSFIRSGMYRTVLVVGADTLTKVCDYQDRTTCILFGDGAGAIVLQASEEKQGVLSTHLFSDGAQWHLLNQPGGGSRNPATHETVEKRLHYIKMKGNELFKFAVRTMEHAGLVALRDNGLTMDDIDLYIPHQANIRIMEAAAKRLGCPPEKVYSIVDRYANTSNATVPMALDEAIQEGRAREGDLILTTSFGGGLTWGSAILRL